MKAIPDDEVDRFQGVYLGPAPITLWWAARFDAYKVGGVVFITILLLEGILPGVHAGRPPLFEVLWTCLLTTGIMHAVDHDKPVTAVLVSIAHVTRIRRPHHPTTTMARPVIPYLKVTRNPGGHHG